MTSNAKYLQPPGLTAIQFQLSIILKHLDFNDYPSAIDAMKRFALITAETDIITKTEQYCKITDRQKELNSATRPLTESDRLAPYRTNQNYLKERSYGLLKLIMQLCDTHGITIKHPKDLSSNANRSSQLFEGASQAFP